jgi:hypothetical protein
MLRKVHDYIPLPTDSEEHFKEQERRSGYNRIIFTLLFLSLVSNVMLVYNLFSPTLYGFPEVFYCGFMSDDLVRVPQPALAPAWTAVAYKAVKFHRGLQDDIPIYERPPSDEVDQAWEQLYACKHL